MDAPQKNLAKNLARIIADRKWTQADLAGKIGKSPAYVSRLMSGTTWISSAALRKLAEVCGVNYDDLIRDPHTGKPLQLQPTKQITITEALRVVNAYDGKLTIKKAR